MNNKKYKVYLTYEFTVKADTEQEAIEKVRDNKGMFSFLETYAKAEEIKERE